MAQTVPVEIELPGGAKRTLTADDIRGPEGPAGPQGGAGPAGADSAVPGPPGPQGPAGPQGGQGPQGAKGDQGDQGVGGAQGPQGAVGAQGPPGPQGPDGVGEAGAQGPPGPVGPQGEVGPAGAQGAQGPAGAAGAVGAQGPVGAKGDQGNVGPQGAQGPAGPDNVLVGKPVGGVGAGDTGKGLVYDHATGSWVPADVATQAELGAHAADTTDVHGIADTARLGLIDAAGRQVLGQRPAIRLNSAKTRWDRNPFVQLPNAIGETEILNIAGQGIVRDLWLAVKPWVPDTRLRVYVDGEAQPSVDVDVGTLALIHNFASNFQVSTQNYHAESDPTATFGNQFSFQLRYPIPYANGLRVVMYLPAAVANIIVWGQAVSDSGVTAPYRLKSAGVTYANKVTVAYNAAYGFFDLQPGAAGWLVHHAMCEKAGIQTFTATRTNASPTLTAVPAGAFVNLREGQVITGAGIPANTVIAPGGINAGAGTVTLSANATSSAAGQAYTITGWTFLERDITITVDGEAQPAIRSSGTEDFFMGSFYYQQRNAGTPVSAVVGATTTSYFANQVLDLLELCGGVRFDNRIKMDLLAGGENVPHEMSWASLYYLAV